MVGQQDRRHLALEPFLAGRLHGLAGEYPVSVDQPVRPQDVPGAIVRAYHEAATARGPALVIVPMDDWLAPAPEAARGLGPAHPARDGRRPGGGRRARRAARGGAEAPAIVAGAGADTPAGWAALVALAERLGCPVWQEPFGARAGFPQDHPQFAGHLPARRSRLRETLGRTTSSSPSARRLPPVPVRARSAGRLPARAGARHRGSRRGAPQPGRAGRARRAGRGLPRAWPSGSRSARPTPAVPARPEPLAPPAPGEPLRAGHVLAALVARLARDAILIEESPSSRPELNARVPARTPMGILSAAMGGLGFALPAAAGLRMALPDRPVLAVAGDGSSMYAIQALWSAARYGAGALFLVMANGRYAVMDALAANTEQAGAVAWLRGDRASARSRRALGCPAERIETYDELIARFDEVVPTLAERDEPLVLEIAIAT